MKKPETKKWIRLSVILYIVILSVVAVVTLAWFVFDETASLETGTEMKITTGSKLEISWYKPATDENKIAGWTDFGSNFIINLPNATYPDITGDGMRFYFPKVLDQDDNTLESVDSFVKITNENYGSDDQNKDLYYITVKLKFRTTLPMDIYLSKDSYVKGMSEQLTGSTATNLVADRTGEDAISRDAIAGAVRVAFVEEHLGDYTGSHELKNIWIPNYKYELQLDNDGNITGFSTDGTPEMETPRYPVGYLMEDPTTANSEKPTMTHYRYGSDLQQYYNGTLTFGTENLATVNENGAPMSNMAAPLLSFTESDIKEAAGKEGADGAAVKTLIIRVWIEGTDREADKAFIDGLLKYKFDFIGIQPKSEFKTQVSNEDGTTTTLPETFKIVDNKVCDIEENVNIDSEFLKKHPMLYSFNGYEWENYSGQFVTQNGETLPAPIFLRYAEQVNTKASKVYLINTSN